jgi:hypothetical protein
MGAMDVAETRFKGLLKKIFTSSTNGIKNIKKNFKTRK